MTDVVNSPAHYTQSRFTCECIDITRHMTFCAGNATKYVWRHAEKNGVEDLRKAAVYLRWAIEDGGSAWLPGARDRGWALMDEHVFVPWRDRDDIPDVYEALLHIGRWENPGRALLIVRTAIDEYETAS